MEKKLLLIDEKRGNLSVSPSGGAEGSTIEPLLRLLSFMKSFKSA
jgi:hypothetical protein